MTVVEGQPTGYNIRHTTINVDSIDFSGHQLFANAVLLFDFSASVLNVETDLLGFTVDSVTTAQGQLFHSYNDTILDIALPGTTQPGDSALITVYYHGTPAMDASGWGGFYFSGSYAFNLGVGFAADPHNYGRAWYPCLDNFQSRSTYDFNITTPSGLKAFCNGSLINQTILPNGNITWHWRQPQSIPSYLVSMAVGPYVSLQRTSNNIPVEWAAEAADTNAVLATFSNLDTTVSRFISAYGPYVFDKIGYCLVPFNSGAMEHAASIHIGKAYINGTQSYATLWAHELAHMWWGDKVTCATAEDMWLNEGFASYNEYYYTQFISGAAAYKNAIRTNHRKQLQFAHTPAGDGSYYAMNNIPHAVTYGTHVYNKGADIVHTLRNYMGDSAFFTGCQTYMNNLQYSSASSSDLRDQLTLGSGINMSRFFDDWIFTPGWPHFSIDSVVYAPGGLDHYWVYTRQRGKGNNHLYEMPVEVTFSNGLQDTTVTVVIDSATNVFHIPLIMVADWVSLDIREKISDAIVDNIVTVTSTGALPVNETNVTLQVTSPGAGNTKVRIEHNFVAPDPFKTSNPGIRLSDLHYWKVDGYFEAGFAAGAIFFYDGSISSSTGYLDNNLITGMEDSLVMLYRAGTWDEWTPVSGFIVNTGPSHLDKKGNVTISSLQKGEYALGFYDYTVGLYPAIDSQIKPLEIFPNPSADKFTIKVPELPVNAHECSMAIFDNGGRLVTVIEKNNLNSRVEWAPVSGAGIYHAQLIVDGVITAAGSMIYQK